MNRQDKPRSIQDLEKEAQAKAIQNVCSLFSNLESLAKLDNHRSRYLDLKSQTEAQLKMSMQTQLDAAQKGLDKLNASAEEAVQCEQRYPELREQLSNLMGLSSSLNDLKNLATRYNQLAAAMENMNYLVIVPESIEKAKGFIETDKLLDAHKIIQELESVRDQLIMDIMRSKSSTSNLDTQIVNQYFTEVDTLNNMMMSKIRLMGQRLYDVSITNNVLLVDCIRLIDREERADTIWNTRHEKQKFMPKGRPKRWKELFFQNISKSINNQVQSSVIAFDGKKTRLATQTVDIKIKTKRYLKLAKNLLPVYFPPDYQIFNRVVEMFHDAIGEFTVQCLNRDDLEMQDEAHLIQSIEQYQSEDFMKDSYLDIKLEELNLNYPVDLLQPEERASLNRRFVMNVQQYISRCMVRALASEMEFLRKPHERPNRDSSGKFLTSLPQIVLQFIENMVGPDKLFAIVGSDVTKMIIEMYIREMTEFAHHYKQELQKYRDEYVTNRHLFEYYSEFAVAHVYVSEVIAQLFEGTIMMELDKDLMFKKSMVQVPLRSMKQAFQEVTEFCLEMLEQMFFMDLAPYMAKQMTREWLNDPQLTRLATTYVVTLNDYNSKEWKQLSDVHYKPFLRRILEKLLLKWLHALLSKKIALSTGNEDRMKLAKKIRAEWAKMSEDCKIELGELWDDDIDHAYRTIEIIGTLVGTRDRSIVSLDIGTLKSDYPDIRFDQMIAIVMIRGDLKLQEAKEAVQIIDGGNSTETTLSNPSRIQIFHKLHLEYNI